MHPTLNATGISSINVDRLKQEMTRRGLPTHGLTPILAERLQQAIGNPLLAQQLASTTMIPEMYDMLVAGDVESIRMWLDAGFFYRKRRRGRDDPTDRHQSHRSGAPSAIAAALFRHAGLDLPAHTRQRCVRAARKQLDIHSPTFTSISLH